MIKKTISEKFTHGNFVFTYYRFLDKFHVEPVSFRELLEFGTYMDIDSAVHKLIADSRKQEK